MNHMHIHTHRAKGKTDYSVAGEGVTKRAASGPFGMICHHVVTKRAGVKKRAGCASNLTRFVTVTKRVATGPLFISSLFPLSRPGADAPHVNMRA